MQKFLVQAQMLLAALSAALPLAPASRRADLAQVLEAIAQALRMADVAASAAENFAGKVAALRAEVEAMAEGVSETGIEAAFDRVRTASAAFRAALAEVS